MSGSIIERLVHGRDVRTRGEAAEQIKADAETIKRLTYTLRRIRQMADNASYRIGIPGKTPDLGNIQQGFQDISAEADEVLARTSPEAAPHTDERGGS